jgi:type I pantothenate kinase|tara:strand:+ start:122 stop:997 length:876 start_codon:yes stop_codon:yes gene_type:complete
MNTIKLSINKFMNIKFNKIISKKSKSNLKKCKNKTNTKEYIQLCKLIQYKYEQYCEESSLLTNKKTPFIIGINGSVSSGKSHAAKIMKNILKCLNGNKRVHILSSDNFIYSNKSLRDKKIFDQKGYPRSYDWKLLHKVLNQITQNKKVETPFYDQTISDIKYGKKIAIPANIDILILEGINILKPSCRDNLDRFLLSDYLDYSIYFYVGEKILRKWFYKRLFAKRKVWKKNKTRKKLTNKSVSDFRKISNQIWTKYNKRNLEEFIRPYRYRADVVIYKNKNHNLTNLEFVL